MTRVEKWGLAGLLVGAWVLRVSPFFRPTGVLGWPVDYDEGVYLSAAAALARGELPWRDFAFLHPPAVLTLFAPLTLLGAKSALIAARTLMTCVGVANVWLIFLLVRRHTSVAAAFVGAALYAAWPEAVFSERRALLEPVLNLGALTAVHLTLISRRAAPVVLGLTLGVKTWGAFWVLGLLSARAWRAIIGGLAVGALLVAVFAWVAPATAFEQLVLVHLGRPPDGDLDRLVRLKEMFVARSVAPLLVLLSTSFWLVRSRALPVVRVLATTFAVFVAAFLSASAWWNQYDAALAAVVAPLCGVGLGLALPRLKATHGLLLGLALASPGVVAVLRARHLEQPEQRALANRVREALQPTARACAFEAVDLVLADRWPSTLIDSYGQQLVDARTAGRFATAAEAFASEASQRTLRVQLQQCDLVVRGWRGDAQMSPSTRAWFEQTFRRRLDDVWVR